MDLIEHPIPTQRAWLTWQGPFGRPGNRDRLAVGELRQNGTSVSFRYLGEPELAVARAAGFDRYVGLPLDSPHVEQLGIEVLMGRLPPKSRGDFSDFLEQFGLPNGRDYSDLTLLAYTGAQLLSDSFSVTETFEGFEPPFEYVLDVAHYQDYYTPGQPPAVGTQVRFERDTEYQNGQQAVQVLCANGSRLGYVHQLQADCVGRWVDNRQITGRVYLANEQTPAPRLFVKAKISVQDR